MKSKVGLIVGGSGALGKNVISVFKRNGWSLLNLDVKVNEEANSNFIIDPTKRMQEQVAQVHEHTR
jgi:NAD(P)-dependent dehydrogenase (short-subunit alcohol dehydrogenase family)